MTEKCVKIPNDCVHFRLPIVTFTRLGTNRSAFLTSYTGVTRYDLTDCVSTMGFIRKYMLIKSKERRGRETGPSKDSIVKKCAKRIKSTVYYSAISNGISNLHSL